jgi:hypothetical protein
MIQSDVISLSEYRNRGRPLTSREDARYLWRQEQLERRGCARIDFSEITPDDLSPEFIAEFFKLEETETAKVWLSPINYSRDVAHFLAGHFLKLKNMRTENNLAGFVQANLHFP